MTVATATEIQNNFGRYLSAVMNGDEIMIGKFRLVFFTKSAVVA